MTNLDSLIFAATSDLAGKTRGKAFPITELKKRSINGVGWTPTNVMITCFDTIVSGPFGSLGDLVLVPDPSVAASMDLPGATSREHLVLGDILDLGGKPWECCTRSILKAAIERLERLAGVRVNAAFEHEFQFRSNPQGPGNAFGYGGFAARRAFGEQLSEALRGAGLVPDTFMREYGPDQYEITVDPAPALTAADQAVILREFTYLIARALDEEVTFTPIRSPSSVGNGVHIHMSLVDTEGSPATWSADSDTGLSPVAGSFAAGIVRYMPDMLALTASSDISFLRLTPNRWSAAYNNLAVRDREAALRICPYTATDPKKIARQFNIEYRAADATASPHLALATLIHAGAQGIEDGLCAPEPTTGDISVLSSEALAKRGLTRLPQTLEEALTRFEQSDVVRSWFGQTFSQVFAAHKRGEMDLISGKTPEERCALYEMVY